MRFYCSHQSSTDRHARRLFISAQRILHRPLTVTLHTSSYLHPGGEREWKVDRENISALSAIFFHKWLRAIAENHGGSAVHSQLQCTGRDSGQRFLYLRPHRCPPGRKPSIRQACSAPWNLQSTIHTGRIRRGVKANKTKKKELQRQRAITRKSLCSPVRSLRNMKRAICIRSRCFSLQMSAAVMLPVTHNRYGPAVRRQAETEEEGV